MMESQKSVKAIIKEKALGCKKLILCIGIIFLVLAFRAPFAFADYIETIFGQQSFPFERGIVQYQTLEKIKDLP